MRVQVVRGLLPYVTMGMMIATSWFAVRAMDTHNWWWAVPGVSTWGGTMAVLLRGGSWLAEQEADTNPLSEDAD